MKSKPERPVRLFLSDAELSRIFDGPVTGKTAAEHQIARALREVGRPAVQHSNKLDDVAKKVKSHMELHAGDYVFKLDLGTIGNGLLELFKKK